LKQLHKQEVDENDVWKARRDNKRSNKLHPKEDQDMEIFMQDIEEDPEIRQNVNLFRDDDVIERLNAQMSKLDLGGKGDENDEPKKSPIGQALDSGTATIGNEQRKVLKGARKTTKGKVIQE
jgi:hypothetical protein